MNPNTETRSPAAPPPFLHDSLPRRLPPLLPPAQPARAPDGTRAAPRPDRRGVSDFPALSRLAAPAHRDLLELAGMAVPAALILLVGAVAVILAAAG